MSRCISTSLIGLPRIRALPAVGKISLISSLMVVDLPAPFGPIKPNTSPVSTCMFSPSRSEEHTSELQSRGQLVCRLLLEKKKKDYDRPDQHEPEQRSDVRQLEHHTDRRYG